MGLNFEKADFALAKKKNYIKKKIAYKFYKKIVNTTGIKKTFVSGNKEDIISLSLKAAKKIVNDKIIVKIDAVILVTQSPKYNIPSNAFVLHSLLNLKDNCMVFDINHGCSGYIYGLNLADSLFQSNNFKKILLITADTYSKYCKNLKVSSIFSDSASATLLSQNIQKKSSFFFLSKSKDYKFLMQKFSNYNSSIKNNVLNMEGEEIFKFTLDQVPANIKSFLKKNKLKKDNVDFYVFHQASKIVLENLIRKLGISHKKTYINIEKYGNTVSSTIPIIISELMKKKLFKKNKKIILCGFGVGLSMGVSLIET